MRRWIALAVGLLVGLLAPLVAASAAREAETQPAAPAMRIGVINSLAPGVPTGLLAMAMKPFRTYMEDQTGSSGEIVRGGDALELATALKDEKVQIGIFHGHEFAWAKQKHGDLEPIVVCMNHMRSVRAVLVVGAKCKAEKCADLESKDVSLPKDGRDHCRLFFEQRCVKAGVEPTKFFARIARPAETDDALDDVAAGKVAAAVVDAVALERYKKDNGKRAEKLRLMLESEPFPPGVVGYFKGKFPDGEVKKLRDALIKARDNERGRATLALLKLSNFEAAPDGFEDTLKACAKAFPPPAK